MEGRYLVILGAIGGVHQTTVCSSPAQAQQVIADILRDHDNVSLPEIHVARIVPISLTAEFQIQIPEEGKEVITTSVYRDYAP